MSYLHKRDRVFYNAVENDSNNISPRPRTAGRIKTINSNTDNRAWQLDEESRRQHLRELLNNPGQHLSPLGNLVPIEVLIETLTTNKTEENEHLKEKLEQLEEKLLVFEKLSLTDDQLKTFNFLYGTKTKLQKNGYDKSKSIMKPILKDIGVDPISNELKPLIPENIMFEEIIKKDSEIIALENQVSALKLELGDENSDHQQEELQKQLETAELKIKQLEDDIALTNANKSELKMEMQSLKEYCDTIAKDHEKLEQLKLRNSKLEELYKETNAKREVLDNKIKEEELLNKDLGLGVMELKKEIKDLEEANKEFKSRLSSVCLEKENLQDDNTKLKDQLSRSILELEVAKTSLMELKESFAEFEKRKESLFQSREKTFEDTLQKLKTENSELTRKCTEITQQNRSLQHQNDLTKCEMKGKEDSTATIIQQLNSDIRGLKHTLEEYRTQINTLKAQCQCLKEHESSLTSDLSMEKRKLKDIKTELSEIGDKYERIKDERDILRVKLDELASLREQFGHLREVDVTALRLERDQLKLKLDQLSDVEVQCSERTKDLEKMKTEYLYYKEQFLKCYNEKLGLETKLMEGEEKVKCLEHKLELTDKGRDEQQLKLSELIRELRSELSSKDLKISVYEEQLVEFEKFKEEIRELQELLMKTIDHFVEDTRFSNMVSEVAEMNQQLIKINEKLEKCLDHSGVLSRQISPKRETVEEIIKENMEIQEEIRSMTSLDVSIDVKRSLEIIAKQNENLNQFMEDLLENRVSERDLEDVVNDRFEQMTQTCIESKDQNTGPDIDLVSCDPFPQLIHELQHKSSILKQTCEHLKSKVIFLEELTELKLKTSLEKQSEIGTQLKEIQSWLYNQNPGVSSILGNLYKNLEEIKKQRYWNSSVVDGLFGEVMSGFAILCRFITQSSDENLELRSEIQVLLVKSMVEKEDKGEQTTDEEMDDEVMELFSVLDQKIRLLKLAQLHDEQVWNSSFGKSDLGKLDVATQYLVDGLSEISVQTDICKPVTLEIGIGDGHLWTNSTSTQLCSPNFVDVGVSTIWIGLKFQSTLTQTDNNYLEEFGKEMENLKSKNLELESLISIRDKIRWEDRGMFTDEDPKIVQLEVDLKNVLDEKHKLVQELSNVAAKTFNLEEEILTLRTELSNALVSQENFKHLRSENEKLKQFKINFGNVQKEVENLKKTISQLEQENLKLHENLSTEQTKLFHENDDDQVRPSLETNSCDSGRTFQMDQQIQSEDSGFESSDEQLRIENQTYRSEIAKLKNHVVVLKKILEDTECKLRSVITMSNENLGLLKKQFDRDLQNLYTKHNESVGRLQKIHDDTLDARRREYEQENEAQQEIIGMLRNQLSIPSSVNKKILFEDSSCQVEMDSGFKPIDVEELPVLESKVVEKKVQIKKCTHPIRIRPMRDETKTKRRMVASPNLAEIVDKILYQGFEHLTVHELTVLHSRTCQVTKAKLQHRNKIQNLLTDEEKYLNRLQKLEENLMVKQKDAVEKMCSLEKAIKKERKQLTIVKETVTEKKHVPERHGTLGTEAVQEIPKRLNCYKQEDNLKMYKKMQKKSVF